MLSYEQLDAIADSVNPVLLGLTLVVPWTPWFKAKLRPVRWIVAVLLALAIVYGMQFVDATLGWWPRWKLDYSTHSALAIALIVLWSFASLMGLAVGLGVFGLYAALMVYQQYHTWADILSTALVIGPLVWGVGAALRPRRPPQHH